MCICSFFVKKKPSYACAVAETRPTTVAGIRALCPVDCVRRMSSSSPSDAHRVIVGAISEEFVCPIPLELPMDAVTAEDGRIYERSCIAVHISINANEDLSNSCYNYHKHT